MGPKHDLLCRIFLLHLNAIAQVSCSKGYFNVFLSQKGVFFCILDHVVVMMMNGIAELMTNS